MTEKSAYRAYESVSVGAADPVKARPAGPIRTPYTPGSAVKVTRTESPGPSGVPSRLSRPPAGTVSWANGVLNPSGWMRLRVVVCALET